MTSGGRRVIVRSYPASVDPASLAQERRSDDVRVARGRLTEHLDRRLIVRADRLDPAKNQVVGFRAFERLLETRPDLRRQVRFVAVLSPSRTDLAAYQAYRAAVVRTIEEVNRRFADECGGPPIALHLESDRPLALAAIEGCDVLLANSVADGMNLVPKEWAVVARRTGAAVISETAGVAAEAADTALLVPPHDVERTAMALGAALDMPEAERARRLERFRTRVMAWTSRDWLSAQMADIDLRGEASTTGAQHAEPIRRSMARSGDPLPPNARGTVARIEGGRSRAITV
jgi:trehalose 6-phosphate synthase